MVSCCPKKTHRFCVFSVIPAHGSRSSLSLLLLLLLTVAGFFGDDLQDVNYADVRSNGGLNRQTWGSLQVRAYSIVSAFQRSVEERIRGHRFKLLMLYCNTNRVRYSLILLTPIIIFFHLKFLNNKTN